MIEVISSVTTAIKLVSRLKEISEKLKDAQLNNLVGDLSLQLADLKVKLATVVEENVTLKQRVRELQNVEGEPCPRCQKRSWQLESSRRDSVFGSLGGMRRVYKCSSCGFSEEQLFTPSATNR
jgi:regulator of replication initiation timing